MSSYPLFSVIGIEIEYMLVDQDHLNVQPKSDLILSALAGQLTNEVTLGDIAVSNELVLHVLELKNKVPLSPKTDLTEAFQNTLLKLKPLLDVHHLFFLPGAAHPWMDPHKETLRWPHDNHAIYDQFHSIFNCQGHGWSNLQCMHLNLPYSNQEEFCQLHNVIRLILPLLPALAASSPVLDGKVTGLLDSRLHFYCQNQIKIPSIGGDIIPDFIRTEEEYQEKILNPMYKEISPFDPERILQYPWLNSRAAIPKFDQKAIEIRILDSQECVEADIAIALAIHALLQHWHHSSSYHLDKPCDTRRLKGIFDCSIEKGLAVKIEDSELMRQWQLPLRAMNIREIWTQLIEKISSKLTHKQQVALELILTQGNLSERILLALGQQKDKKLLHKIYNQLVHCLLTNEQFMP